MPLSPVTLAMAGLFVLSGMGAAAITPFLDNSCGGSYYNLGTNEGNAGMSNTDGVCDRYPNPCPDGDAVAATIGPHEVSSLVRFEIHNQERPVESRFCLTDQDGVKRIDEKRRIATNTTLTLDLWVPPGIYDGGYTIEGERFRNNYRHLDPGTCPDHAMTIQSSYRLGFFGGVSSRGTSPQCIDRPAQESDDPLYPMGTQSLLTPPDAKDVQTMAATLAVASGGILAVVTLLRSDRMRWMLAFFFTRIRAPKALDHRVREEIQGLVESQPGLRAEDIRKRLGLGHGQSAHHLRILMQSELLEALRISGSYHFYPAGRYGTREKRRLALLNHEAASRLYDAIKNTNGGDVTTLAEKTELSTSYASRLAARLAAEGLVKRRRDGNRVVLCAASDT